MDIWYKYKGSLDLTLTPPSHPRRRLSPHQKEQNEEKGIRGNMKQTTKKSNLIQHNHLQTSHTARTTSALLHQACHFCIAQKHMAYMLICSHYQEMTSKVSLQACSKSSRDTGPLITVTPKRGLLLNKEQMIYLYKHKGLLTVRIVRS